MNLAEKAKILQNYLRAGEFYKVIEGCKILNKKFPNNPFFFNLAGLSYQNLGQHSRAIFFFQQALKADDKNISAMNNLANSLKATDKNRDAIKIYDKILKIDPDYINALNNYSNLKVKLNDFDGAINLLKKALILCEKKKINPTNIMYALASAYLSINNKVVAIDLLNKIIKINANHTLAHKMLSSIYKYSEDDPKSIEHLKYMENIYQNNSLNEFQKINISFSIGKAFDDLKKIESAFNYFKIANQLGSKKNISNLNKEIKIMNDLMNIFENIDLKYSSNKFDTKKIIFICGMPRSGTTLLEQILSSHNEVHGAGELVYLQNSIQKNFFSNKKLDKDKIVENQKSNLNIVNDDYFGNLSLHKIDENIIIDKAPQNFQWIGFIKIFFPNAKILNCKRNAKDVCFSIFRNSLPSSMMNWSYSQKEIALYYNKYKELMNFWKIKLPEIIYTFEYEKLVSDKKNEIKKLLKFCDLEWDDKCLSFHKNSTTPIKTVSMAQAREPIYKSSINSYDNYKDHLKEMFEYLI